MDPAFRIAQMVGVTVEEVPLRDGDLPGFADGDQTAILFMEAVKHHAMSNAIW
ncbi:hypothetical protein LWE61_01480 [Sphingobium sufflavum]|uniref:hypothetical protein n=1 Tax=Sphingobium sufflavum TaxID=1129547 RepID=UPI001F18BDA1|nr:hypothetical protein [Sphingobium sufflavum]MCE7795221.1 hypothetical protein [Sphingobium sufflavum]